MNFFFILSNKISIERLEWISIFIEAIQEPIVNEKQLVIFFISGEALYSLIDKRYIEAWTNIMSNPLVSCCLDAYEMQIIGLNKEDLHDSFKGSLKTSKREDRLDFWARIIDSLKDSENPEKIGYIQFQGPYMHRNSIYALNTLQAAIKKDIEPELYVYLDGIHMGHENQKPSAFENVGETLSYMRTQLKQEGKDLLMLACSRCGMARGYVKKSDIETLYDSADTISSFFLCNLNLIIEKFKVNPSILTSNMICVKKDNSDNNSNSCNQDENNSNSGFPPVFILITHGPYGTEWCFGGLSFAIACANHGINTTVIFIEDGVFSLIGRHNIPNSEKIFNIQETIEAIHDFENLNLYAYYPSLELRNLITSIVVEGVNYIKASNLKGIMLKILKTSLSNNARIFFF